MKEPTVSDTIRNPFNLTADELQRLLATDTHPFPELQTARGNVESLRAAPQAQVVLAQTEQLMAAIGQIPQTPYTLYRLFVRDGDRGRYEMPYFLKRTNLAAAALRLFLGVETGSSLPLLDVTQDYLWSICEES